MIPRSPYAAAKLYAHNIVKIYREGYGLWACNGILFNHESPRRGKNFVTMKIVEGVKNIIEGKQEQITLGNLNSRRDWGHAKDYVYGMWLILQHTKADDFVLATGETYSVKQFVEKTFKMKGTFITWQGEGINEMGIDKKTGKVLVRVDPKYFRPCELDYLLGDPTKAETQLNWRRKYNLDVLIKDMYFNS